MRRLLLLIAGFLVLVGIIAPAALFYYVAYTEDGLRTVVSYIPERIGRASLSVEEVSGTFVHGVRIGRLVIDHERARLRFEDIEGRAMLLPLLWQTIRSPDLSIGSLTVEVRRRRTPVQPYSPRFLPRGLIIRSDRVHVRTGTLIVPSGRRFEATNLRAAGVARHRLIRLFEAELETSGLEVAGVAELRAQWPMELTADARISRRAEGQPTWTLQALADGNLDVLPLEVRFLEPFRADFTGRAEQLTGAWQWSGEAQVHDFDPMAWGGGALLGHVTGRLSLAGNAEGFTAQGPLTPSGLGIGEVQALLEGAYANRLLFARRLELTHAPSGARASASGAIGIAAGGPRLDLQGSWRSFRWPLAGAPAAIHSDSGRFTLAGLWPYELRASGVLAPAGLDSFPVELEGRLAKDRLIVREAQIAVFGGRARLGGELAWAPREQWQVSGTAADIDPATVRADLPGRLAFAFGASGEGFGRDARFSASVRDLGGELRRVPARGEGSFARQGGTWQFDGVRLALGRTELSLDGRIDQRFDLRFAVDARDLSLLAADSRGRLQARGIVNGTVRDPVLDFTVSGRDIRHDFLALESFDARVDFDARRQRPSRVDVRARNLTLWNRRIEQLAFNLAGTAANHVVDLDLRAAGLAVDSRAAGAFVAGSWRGTLNRLLVNGTEALRLELESPVGLELSTGRLRLERLCLHGTPARTCGDAEWNREQWFARVEASEMPVSVLTSGLTPGVDYRGTINATAHVFGAPSQPVQGSLRADLADARLSHRQASGRVQVITLGSGLVNVNATSTAITADVGLTAGQIGTVAGNVTVQREAARWQDMPLRGRLNARTTELGYLSLYLPQVDRASGQLAADLALSGTLGTPLVDGSMKLADAELDFYQINLALRDVGLEARLLANGLDFRGSARIGEGSASARGRLEWRESLPYGRLRLEGEGLRVVDIPEARIEASPNLEFAIAGRRIEVTGDVQVPFAHIEPADLATAVRTSSDEIIVGEREQGPAQRFDVTTQITLTLGDRVTLNTSGLTGRLAGSLTLRSGIDEITRGTGELGVTEGRYAAFGRLLDIQRGRLIFSGGPIGNPGVDIRAVRQFPEVLAGVNVRGTLQQPRMTFFSEPSLPQSQIVSLILAGGALASSTPGAPNGRAGTELLAQGGAILAQQLGSRVGIEDVGIESNLDNETAIVLGKYLSPRLYVSYGISLTESLNTLKLRYSLGDRWTIRTEVGEERSADLVYTIEK